MWIFERIANFIFHIATGDEKRRWLITPLVGSLFLCFVTLFVVAAISTDRCLSLPSINLMPWTLILALLFLVAGSILLIWTWAPFLRSQGTAVPVNPPKKLITSGLYAYSRNPMVLGMYLVLWGIGFITGSLSMVIFYTPLFIAAMTFYVKNIEEKEMQLKFGQAYLKYKKKVPMYLPKIGWLK